MRTPHPPTRPALRLHTHTHTPSARRAAVPTFCNGRQLRDYQLKSLEWNVINWWTARNCILGDEASRQRSLSYIPAPPPLPQPATTHPLTRQPTHPRTRPPHPPPPPPPPPCVTDGPGQDRAVHQRAGVAAAVRRDAGALFGHCPPHHAGPLAARDRDLDRHGAHACVCLPACLLCMCACACVCGEGDVCCCCMRACSRRPAGAHPQPPTPVLPTELRGVRGGGSRSLCHPEA